MISYNNLYITIVNHQSLLVAIGQSWSGPRLVGHLSAPLAKELRRQALAPLVVPQQQRRGADAVVPLGQPLKGGSWSIYWQMNLGWILGVADAPIYLTWQWKMADVWMVSQGFPFKDMVIPSKWMLTWQWKITLEMDGAPQGFPTACDDSPLPGYNSTG